MGHKHLFKYSGKTAHGGSIFACVCSKKKSYALNQKPSSDCVDS